MIVETSENKTRALPVQSVGTAPEVPLDPSLGETFRAAAENENILISTYQYLTERAGLTEEPGHDPLDVIRGTQYEGDLQPFIGSRSTAETHAIMARIDRKAENDRILEASGAAGVVADIGMGWLDPTIFIPGVAVAKVGRAGWTAARVGGAAAVSGLGQAALQESVLQLTQEKRTLNESLINIGTGTVLAGILGAGAGALLGRAERKNLEALFETDRNAIRADLTDETVEGSAMRIDGKVYEGTNHAEAMERAAGDLGVTFDDLAARLDEKRGTADDPEGYITSEGRFLTRKEGEEFMGTGLPAAAGATASDLRQIKLESTLGMAEFINRTPFIKAIFGNPQTRTWTKPFLSARRSMADLAETSLRFIDERMGVAISPGGAVDRKVRQAVNTLNANTAREMDRLYTQHYKGRSDANYLAAQATKARASFENARGTMAPDKLTSGQFKEQVSIALHEGDKHVIPEVAEAARYVRANVLDPWKDRAIKAGLLDKDVAPENALSYFMLVYKKGEINARRPEVQKGFADWLESEQAEKAAARERMVGFNDELQRVGRWSERIEKRLTSLQTKEAQLDARLSERAMEVGRTEKRAGTLEERQASIDEEISDIEEFVGAMREEVRDPKLLDQLETLKAHAHDLRLADKPVTEADLRKIEQQELKGILVGPVRRAAEMLVGRRTRPKPSFVQWFVDHGGIKDAGGDVRAMLGEAKARPGLINNKSGLAIDRFGEMLGEQFGWHFGGAPTDSEVLRVLDDAVRGKSDPSFWVEKLPDAERVNREAALVADRFDELFSEAGIHVEKVSDVAKALRGDAGVTLEDLDKIAADMEAAGASVPVAGQRARADEVLAEARGGISQVRALIASAIEDKRLAQRRSAMTGTRADEARFGERQNRGRLGVLQQRLELNELRRELMTDALVFAEREQAAVRAKIETEIDAWKGKSTGDAKNAIAAREKYAEEAGREEGAPRLRGADKAVDRTVKSIIARDLDLSRQELEARAGEWVDRIVGSPDGRLAYDAPSGGPMTGAPGSQQPRGPLASRVSNMPVKILQDLGIIENDVEAVTNTFLRTIVPDVLLTEKFGDVDMTDAFKKLREEHEALALAAPSEKARVKLKAEYDEQVADLAGVRDRVRGTYGLASNQTMRNAGRVAQGIRHFNGVTSLGGQMVNSLAEVGGPVLVFGFNEVLGDAYRPFVKGLMGSSEAWARAKQQYRAMSVGNELYLHTRAKEIFDLHDVYKPESRLERGMAAGSSLMQILNIAAPWTDWGKTISAVTSGNSIIRHAKALADGTATAKQRVRLLESGMPPELSNRIWKEFEKGGEIVDGVYLPNTADWTDLGARDAFENAIGREVDIAVITPGQEKSFWLSDPVLGTLGQFKSFTAASTERMMLRNMQRADMRTLQGIMTMIPAGMLSYAAYGFFTGKELSADPTDWIREGASRSGFFGWIEETNTFASKVTRGQADMYRLVGSNRPGSKYSSRTALSQLLGPTAGKIEDVLSLTGAAANADFGMPEARAARRLLPFQNLFWLRRLFDEMDGTADR